MLYLTLKGVKMLLKNNKSDFLYRVINNSIQLMQTKANNLLNPHRHYLSKEAKKRLRWLYILYEECSNNVKQASNKIGISRQWLSVIKSIFEKNGRDPRSLEPESRAPCNTSKRNRIPKETEKMIIFVRDNYPFWGEKKIARILWRDYDIKVSKNTVNRYLHKHLRIDPKISDKNKKAWQGKKEREKEKGIILKLKYRPPNQIKDYLPGALCEKDMKLVPRIDKISLTTNGKYRRKDNFYYQHSLLDSFTRIRVLGLVKDSDSQIAVQSYQEAKKRLPFNLATINTDNGGENEKDFSKYLNENNIIHFYSRAGTPTDNPRVERSHLTDEKEFYGQGNIYKTFEEQKSALQNWEHTYNYIRPNQALGYLTPIEFYKLWKKNPEKAYQIVGKYRNYLRRQTKRLARTRKIKRKEQIEKLMQFIDAKLNKKVDLKVYKLQLAECQLCSWG